MNYNLKNYTLEKEYRRVNKLNRMEVSRNQNIHTVKIAGKNYILNKTIKNLELYTNLSNLYPIGEFFLHCGVSKSYKQALCNQNKHLVLVIIEGVKFIELTDYFYFMVVKKKRTPYIINSNASERLGVNGEETMIQCIRIGFIEDNY